MTFRFSNRSLAMLAGVHPLLQGVAHRAIALTRVDFGVTEGLRTVDRQVELLTAGASQTMDSRHLSGHAIDVLAYVGTVGRWDFALYYDIADAFRRASREREVALRWGGCWERIDNTRTSLPDMVAQYSARQKARGKKPFLDGAHFELDVLEYP